MTNERLTVAWSEGSWTHAPAAVSFDGNDMLVTATKGSDAWRHTSYGFVHSSEHALVRPMEPGTAVEVEYTADLSEQFDQARIFLLRDEENWVKCATELADGHLYAGAVVTRGFSDWSTSPVTRWLGSRVRVRASWDGSAVTIRAGRADGPLKLFRVFAWDDSAPLFAGPLVNAPTRDGLTVRFHSWSVTPADASLHP